MGPISSGSMTSSRPSSFSRCERPLNATMRLGVNIDHVATVRQARRGSVPDPVDAARACERAGADSIVCHLREDRRHIQDHDVARLLKTVHVPVNLEMSIAPEIVKIARRLKPRQVTLVPERRRELTTEGGLDVVRLAKRLRGVVSGFHEDGIDVSVFVDPVRHQLEAAAEVGATIVELHTGRYANTSRPTKPWVRELAMLYFSAQHAQGLGMAVAAGHGLDYENVKAVAAMPAVEELNIGFSIVSRAIVVGIERAVREMKRLIASAGRGHG